MAYQPNPLLYLPYRHALIDYRGADVYERSVEIGRVKVSERNYIMYFTVARQPNVPESIISNPFSQEYQLSRLSRPGDASTARNLKHRKRKENLKRRTTEDVLRTANSLGQQSASDSRRKRAQTERLTKSQWGPNAGTPASLHPCIISETPMKFDVMKTTASDTCQR